MISVSNLTVEFSSVPLFNDINFVINNKDKVALVGKNGAGKTTLLKIIAGLQSPTQGSVGISKENTLGYLPQHMEVCDTRTVIEEVQQVFEKTRLLQEELTRCSDDLANRTDYESEEYLRLVEKVSQLTDQIALSNSDNEEAEIEKTLLGLGFKRSDFNRPTSEFSGGWRMRIELAKILLRKPDILLLDEPTNHLDIESIQWLEDFIKTRANMVILVSHDRAFMDNTTQRTIEIIKGKIYDYKASYSDFIKLRKERIDQQTRAYQNQQKQIQDTEDFIEKFRYKATKAVQVQSRIKQLAKIELIEIDDEDNTTIKLRFPPAPRSGDFPLIIEDLKKSYGSHIVIDDVNLTLRRGEKVAFIGKNGEGKSTLVKCINGEIQYDGKLKIGHNVKIGYFAQNQAQILDGELTVFDTIDNVAVGDIRTKIKDLLGAFHFGGEASDKKVKVLSGGEKTRLAMLRLLLEPVNLLILDEPTNHLDLRTKDVLKQAIKSFEGTVIIVSHDREFLDGLVDKIYYFGGGKVREYLGGIYEFIDSRHTTQAFQTQAEPVQNKTPEAGIPQLPLQPGTPQKQSKLSYAEQREKEKMRKRLEKKIKEYEEQISKLEDEIRQLESQMSVSDNTMEIVSLYESKTKELENAMSYWELAMLEMEQ